LLYNEMRITLRQNVGVECLTLGNCQFLQARLDRRGAGPKAECQMPSAEWGKVAGKLRVAERSEVPARRGWLLVGGEWWPSGPAAKRGRAGVEG
jgi:hypothetical protein